MHPVDEIYSFANVTTIALELPASCLTGNGNGVIGGWTSASLRQTRVLNPRPSFARPEVNGTLGTNIANLAPANFPRNDLLAAFLTGFPGVNQLASVTPSEMQRLNTAIPAQPADQQSSFGVAGNDLAGFPNGRRPGDDVVDIELRVAMGALCYPIPVNGVPTNLGLRQPADAPVGNVPFTDGAPVSAAGLTACGGGGSNSPITAAPAISGFANTTIEQDATAAPLSFTVRDADSPPESLLLDEIGLGGPRPASQLLICPGATGPRRGFPTGPRRGFGWWPHRRRHLTVPRLQGRRADGR